jgi:hypothetical protein
MNLVSSPLASIQLNWVKSKNGRHELTANGPILGSLRRVGFWKSASQAQFKGKMWSFQRRGCARTEILEEPDSRPVAQFRANWLGGGTLIFHDGRQFQLVCKGFWRPLWFWVDDQGRKLIEVVPHSKSVNIVSPGSSNSAGDLNANESLNSAGNLNASESWLPVLIMFSWHQILKTNDAAAMAAMVSAAAAG